MPNVDGSYTTNEVRDLINVSALATRLESIEQRSKDNWSELKEHIHSEDLIISKLYDKINELNEKMGSSSDQLHTCKSELEDKVKVTYVTKEQLEIAMQKNSEILGKLMSEKFEGFARRMEESNKIYREELQEIKEHLKEQGKIIEDNKHNINKYLYIGTGVVSTISVIWVVIESFIK